MIVQISVDIEEISQEVSVNKMIAAYGPANVLGCFTVNEILMRFDHDSILEAIGEERIKNFLELSEKKASA